MLKNPFRKKTYAPSEHPMQVLIIDPDAKNLSASLGISDERFEELLSLVSKALDGLKVHGNIGELIAEASSRCVHPNELAMVSYMLGSMIEKATNPMSLIDKLMRP